MKRTALTDGTGAWFNEDSAEKFEEDCDWDGSNHISKATQSQTEHECLWRTKSGKWILNRWSQWQGTTETYTEIDDNAAAAWIIINDNDSDIVKTQIAEMEL